MKRAKIEWYIPEIEQTPSDVREVLEQYSGITPDKF